MRIAPAPQRLFKRQTEQDSGARNGNATGIALVAITSLRAQGTGRGGLEATSQAQRGNGFSTGDCFKVSHSLAGQRRNGTSSSAQKWQTEPNRASCDGNATGMTSAAIPPVVCTRLAARRFSDSLAGATGASVGKTSNTALEMRVQDLPEGLLDDGLGVGDTTCANRMPRTRGAADGLPNGRAAP